MECSHEILDSGCCVECGVEVFLSYSTDGHSISRPNNRNSDNVSCIKKELKELDLDPKIKEWVETNLSLVDRNVYGQSSKREVLYAYIYVAHQIYPEIKFDVIEWKNKFVKKKQDHKVVLRLASGILGRPINDEKGPILASMVVLSPLDFLEEILKILGLEEAEKDIREMGSVLIESKPDMLYSNPRAIAIVLVKHFIRKNGMKGIVNIEKRCGASPGTINNLMRKYLKE